ELGPHALDEGTFVAHARVECVEVGGRADVEGHEENYRRGRWHLASPAADSRGLVGPGGAGGADSPSGCYICQCWEGSAPRNQGVSQPAPQLGSTHYQWEIR